MTACGAGDAALARAAETLACGDVESAVTHLSSAIRAFNDTGERLRAATACARLGQVLASGMGNLTAARAWFARARRLVDEEPPCVEQGWVALAAMGCDVDDPTELLAAAELALDRARRFGDVNLETKALADGGLAHVRAGRIGDGMAMLDEAMALACGPADDTGNSARSVCSFFTACFHAGDFERAGSWADLLRRRGLLGPEALDPAFLSGHCDSVQASLLIELGRWGEAEALLAQARQRFEAATQLTSWHPDITLAGLRVRQGRFTDAEALLLGKDQALEALLPIAHLHLARGDHELARATARRGLRAVGRDRLRAVELLTVLVDAELAAGDRAAAAAACEALADRAGDVDQPALRGRGAAARARAAVDAGEPHVAIAELESALDDVDVARLPWLRATLLLELARVRERAGDRAGAVVDARAADAALAGLDVTVPAADVALLERLGVRARPERVAMLATDGRWWEASAGGTRVRLADSKGLRYLAELLGHPGAERHALDLVDRVEPATVGAVDRRRLGDAGELLDARARTAYRHRIEELRADADDAVAAGQLETAERLQDELDVLVRQLAGAFGLGGRSRRAGAVAERARLNVTRALRAATARLADALPDAGAALDRDVRTGLYCAYEPAPSTDGASVRWIVQSAVNEERTR